ncbi:prophage antirepressor-like protein [Kitasatospora sp. MAP12-15]|uniref:BRO-N domain-containing protein n=1 Tax=unclassified Kitasatospora TaxID=2633591 RepID=UPI002476344E|nr:BRO family protein [Kitasatospora sp. MAP12-44]MDH6111803.1 prophage antirepressor-like protein [Kitasatospora sp. MAP12-44]
MDDDIGMVLMRTSFPVTGQPVRVVMIDGEPWFVTADVCRILGRGNPSEAAKIVNAADSRTVDLRLVTIRNSEGYRVVPGEKAYVRGNPLLGTVNESGLYMVLMRSTKPSAAPFQEWVTRELLPSIRRGDTDIPTQRQRMAETLAEAIGQQVQIVAEIDRDGVPGFRVHSDGTVHCAHGEMDFRVPKREEDGGPPFGPYFQCTSVEKVGIRGGTAIPRCGKLKLVELVRRVTADPAAAAPSPGDDEPSTGLMLVELGGARIHGSPQQVAELMRRMAA